MVKWVAVLFGMRAVVGDDGRPYFVLGAAGLIEETSGDKRGEWSNTCTCRHLCPTGTQPLIFLASSLA